MAGMGLKRCAVNLRASVQSGPAHSCKNEIWMGDKFCHRMTDNGAGFLEVT